MALENAFLASGSLKMDGGTNAKVIVDTTHTCTCLTSEGAAVGVALGWLDG